MNQVKRREAAEELGITFGDVSTMFPFSDELPILLSGCDIPRYMATQNVTFGSFIAFEDTEAKILAKARTLAVMTGGYEEMAVFDLDAEDPYVYAGADLE